MRQLPAIAVTKAGFWRCSHVELIREPEAKDGIAKQPRWRLPAASVVLALPVMLAGAPPGHAASYVYFESGPPLYGSGAASGVVPLTYSHGRSLNGATVCVSALYTNWVQVDPVACSSTVVVKGSYGGGSKMAFGRATLGNSVSARLRAEW